MEYVTLSNGVKMPILGYGVYQVSREECENCVADALSVGYRLLDTAQSYFNEEQVGNAIVKSSIARKDMLDKYGVQMEAWAPFGEGRGGLFENPVLSEIAEKYGKTTAQVILRWHIQRGVVVIPKSTHKERMEQNFNVFDFTLSTEDMDKIAALDKCQSSFFSHNDPARVEWFVQMVEERKGK